MIKLKKKKKKKKRNKEELIDPLRCIGNLLGEECHISIKTIESSDASYIEYDSDGDAYFKSLSLKNILKNNNFIEKEIDSWIVFEYDRD